MVCQPSVDRYYAGTMTPEAQGSPKAEEYGRLFENVVTYALEQAKR
jgi:hypothetical protein